MPRARGFTLLEVIVVMLIVAVMLSALSKVMLDARNNAVTRQVPAQLEAIEQALVQFAIQAQRLPCPSDGALGTTGPGAGVERRDVNGDCMDGQARGVVPWRTLGLRDDAAIDPYYGLITYRVTNGLTRNGEMLWANCDPAGKGAADHAGGTLATPHLRCAPGCTAANINACTPVSAIIADRVGLLIRSDALVTAPVMASGLAYVMISHGANRAGAYGVTGALNEPAPDPTTPEGHNAAADAVKAYYVFPAGDDAMVWASMVSVASRAGVNQRVH